MCQLCLLMGFACRSIAMTVPNNDQIAEVLLVSEGFKHARVQARKMVTLFALSQELLSSQQHYDWGLRALKTSLGIAGRELREVRGRGGCCRHLLTAVFSTTVCCFYLLLLNSLTDGKMPI